jgi:hypothetical protein
MSEQEREGTRSGEEAIREIRDKREGGDDVSNEEREFLESEGVRLDPDDEGNRPVA